MRERPKKNSSRLTDPGADQPTLGAESGPDYLFYVALAAALAILGYFAWPMLLGKVYTFDDLANMHIASRSFFARCLADGLNFTWFPNVWCGYYLHGEGQVGMYHPLHRFLYSALSVTDAFNLELFLTYPIMLAGTFFFLRRWKLGRAASMFGAILFAFCGFNLLHAMHFHLIQIISRIPWLLLAIDVAVKTDSRRDAALANLAVTILTASQLLLGQPQIVMYSLIIEGLYVLLLFPWWRGARRVAFIAAAKALGFVVAGVQLLPTYETMTLSDRWHSPTYKGYGLSLPPVNLIQYVAPYLMKGRVITDEGSANTHEYGVYAGAVALVLFAWLLPRLRRMNGPRRLAAGAFVLTLLGLVFAMGRYAYVYAAIANLPPFSWFRAPCRYVLFAYFGMAVAAAVAFDELLKSRRPSKPPSPLALSALFLLPAAGFALVFLSGWPGVFAGLPALASRAARSAELVLSGPMLLALAAVFVFAAARGARHAFVAIILLAAVDQAVYGFSYIRTSPPMDVASIAASVRLPKSDSFFRIEAIPTVDNIATLTGYRLATGYVGLVPKKAFDYSQDTPLRLASVKWKIVKTDVPSETGAPAGRLRLETIPAPMPRARLVANAVVTDDPASLIGKIDLATTALVRSDLKLQPGAPGYAAVNSDLPGDIRLSADAPSRQLLIVSESFHPGWKASIDGRPASPVAVYGDFLGLVVDAGRHEIAFTFAPESLRVGKIISAVGLALVVPFGLAAFFFARRRAQE